MYAVEFKMVANEPYIKIPEFEKFKGQEVRVVLLSLKNRVMKNLQKDKELDFIEYLIDNPIDFPKNFKFNRDEANER